MSTTIDNKVVEMRFDNKEFEKNVQTSISTVDKLKQSLNLTGASRGLENVNAAAKGVNLAPLTGAVETVRTKFSAMEVVAVTALANITNSAVNAGKKIVSSLTVDPIKSGFSEYETQINAVQTILANTESKGKTLTDVNAALDELNAYADKTIYNFTEMTRNIGTFTAAGVDLDTSVAAIKGIANLAAVSGSTSQQASTAMYQLSQALASGTVKLMDWNSIVNAGMGGQVFQDALKETARVHGVAIDKMIEDEGSFRETLSDGWLTSEILTETLSKFTGDLNEEQLKTMGYTDEQIASIIKMGKTANDAATKVKTFTQLFDTLKEAAQSGWTQSWEIIVGDFEEAKVLLTEVSDTFGAVIGASASARNEMLQGWKDLGGRTVLIEAVRNAFQGIVSVITPIKEAFREIFPPMTAKQLYAITEGLKNLTARLKLSDTQSANLKATAKGLFAILDIVKQAISAVWNVIKPLISGVGSLGDGILGVTAKWGDWLVNLNDTIKRTDAFNKALTKVVDFIKASIYVAVKIVMDLVEGVKALAKVLKEKIEMMPGFEALHNLLERFHTRMAQVRDSAGDFKDAVCGAFKAIGDVINWGVISKGLEGFLIIFGALWKFIKTVAGVIGKACSKIGSGLADAFANADFDKVFDIVNGGLLAGILVAIKKFMGGFDSALDEVGGVLGNITDILDSVRGCFEAYQRNLQANTLLKIAGAIAILAASLVVVSLIDSAKLTASIGAITVLFADLLSSMALFGKMSGGMKGVTKSVTAMLGISVAVLILASALKKVASIDADSMYDGLIGVAGLSAIVVATSKAMSKNTGKVMKGATSLIAFAIAIKILASACKDLSTLSWEEMAKGLVGVGVLMAEVSIFLNTAKFGKKAVSTATGMVIMAAAIKILASACGDFGSMDWGSIGKGLTSIGILLAEVAIFTKLTGNAKKVVSTGTALVLIGAAMKIFASAVKDFAGMKWDELGRGLAGMAASLTAVTIAVNLMPKNLTGIGVGLIGVSTALVILSQALGKMGGMSWEELARGLVALGGSMAILAIGLNVMKSTVPGSAAMLIATTALAVLAPILALLGAMSWEGIAKGLVAIAGAFAIMGVAGLVLGPVVPVILGLAGALALIGVGVLGVGVGLVTIAAGLTALSAAFTLASGSIAAGATAIVAALTIIIMGVVALIPAIIKEVGEALIVLIQVIINAIPDFCQAVTVTIFALVKTLVECVPVIVEGIFVLLEAILTTLLEYTPTLVQTAIGILIAMLQGIANNISMVVQTAIDIVLGFIDGVAQKIPDVIQSGVDLLLSFINGMADGVRNNTDKMIEAVNNLMDAVIGAVVAYFENFKEKGKEIIDKIKAGLSDKIEDAKDAIKEVIEKMKEKIGEKVEDFKDAAKDLMEGFIQGIKDKIQNGVDAVKEFGASVVGGIKDFLGINSPSKVFAEIGRYTDEGFAKGLKAGIGDVTKATEDVGQTAIDAMSNSVSKIADVINNDMDAEPTIRPVLDLSNVRTGTKNIDAMLSRTQAIGISASINKTSGRQDSDDSTSNRASGNTYQFTQNNYSPKALSRVEIYRQTKNQFSAMERTVEA